MKFSKLRSIIKQYPVDQPKTVALQQGMQDLAVEFGCIEYWEGRLRKSHKQCWIDHLISLEISQGDQVISETRFWGDLKNSMMMFWLAECAGIKGPDLEDLANGIVRVARAKQNVRMSSQQGKAFRDGLSWDILEAHIRFGQDRMIR